MGAIRKTRRPVSLKEVTWIITDRVSTTKMPSDDGEQDLLADHDGDRSQRSTQRERADVAHEELGRRRC